MAAYGLYTHISSNKVRSMLLLAGLFLLIYVLVYAGALLAEVVIDGNRSVNYYLAAAARDQGRVARESDSDLHRGRRDSTLDEQSIRGVAQSQIVIVHRPRLCPLSFSSMSHRPPGWFTRRSPVVHPSYSTGYRAR